MQYERTNHCEAILSLTKIDTFRCYGVGPEPEDGNQRYWYNLVKTTREDKTRKVRDHLRLLHECVGVDRQPLWEDHEHGHH